MGSKTKCYKLLNKVGRILIHATKMNATALGICMDKNVVNDHDEEYKTEAHAEYEEHKARIATFKTKYLKMTADIDDIILPAKLNAFSLKVQTLEASVLMLHNTILTYVGECGNDRNKILLARGEDAFCVRCPIVDSNTCECPLPDCARC